jgi:hypothetical protein
MGSMDGAGFMRGVPAIRIFSLFFLFCVFQPKASAVVGVWAYEFSLAIW